MTIHLFISQALVSASIYTHLKSGNAIISYDDLRAHVTFLSQLFRGEFIYATAGLTTNLAQTLAGLELDGVITITRRERQTERGAVTKEIGNQASMDAAPSVSSNIDALTLSATERSSGRENFDFYCFLIWPFVEASWLGAISLLMLTPPPSQMSAPKKFHHPNQLHSMAQLLGKTLHAQGLVTYLEAVNKEVLKNAFARFEEDGMLVSPPPPSPSSSSGKASGSVKMLRLADDWTPGRAASGALQLRGSRLWEFCEEVARSRADEGEVGEAQRRRVLRLVESVGRAFWEGVGGVEGSSDDDAAEGTGGGKREAGAGLAVVQDEAAVRARTGRGSLAWLAKKVARARM